MRGVYTSTYKISGLTSAKTLMYLSAPAGKIVKLVGLRVGQESNAIGFQASIAIDDISALGTPTATSVTPTPMEPGDQAASSTVKANVTAAEPTYSTRRIVRAFNSLVGMFWDPVREEEFEYVAAAASIGIRFLTTATSSDFEIELTHQEIG